MRVVVQRVKQSSVKVDGKIVGKGHNEVLKNSDSTCHGEILAIQSACRTLKTHNLLGCELYTTSEPCIMCYGAILWANIFKVYYGCTAKDAEKIGFRDNVFSKYLNKTELSIDSENICREQCLEVFKQYMLLKDKQSY